MNDDLDPLDETLARGLGALAPAEFELDPARALHSMRPALRRARFRRRLAVSTSAFGVIVVAVAGVAVIGRGSGSRLDVHQAAQPTVATGVRPRTPTTGAVSTTTTSQPSLPVVSPTTAPRHASPSTTPPGRGPIPVVPAPEPTVTTSPRTPPPTTPTAPAQPVTKTYVATGGSLTITFSGGRLRLVRYTPDPGYQVELHTNTPTEIEVRFSSRDLSSRIRVRVQDGHLAPEITDN